MIKLGSEICQDYVAATSREWLETNGLGGYALGTISGVLTRRYDGLLVVATHPPVGRIVTLSKMEEAILVGGERYELSTNRYSDTVHPHGYQYLTEFRLDPFPIWTYKIGELTIERSLFMAHGEDSTVLQWRLVQGPAPQHETCRLEVKPLFAFRDHHHLQSTGSNFNPTVEINDGRISIAADPDLPGIYLACDPERVESQGHWYRDFQYSIELERGFDHREDLFQPFSLEFDLIGGVSLIAATDPAKTCTDAEPMREREIKRRAGLIARSGVSDRAYWPLVLAADQFIVNRSSGKTVIAGYPWFSDWGRDTMIALNGLALSTNRPEIAKSILIEFSQHISEGMLPNRFPDSAGTADYNTVDASLWFFEAVRAYATSTGDLDLVRKHLWEKLIEIIKRHIAGTRHQIHMDTDGLLFAGEPGVQLTWMDAKIGDWVVTPRTGKPVEIQALWYNALRIMADLAEHFGDEEKGSHYTTMAEAARASFNGQFWNSHEQCLYDTLNGPIEDASIRSNQVFAVSLHHTMLDHDRAMLVVEKVEAELLTPMGLRSLSRNNPDFVGVYQGSPQARDAAYHQGTVWAWLIGPFVDAYRRVYGRSSTTEERIDQILAPLRSHLSEAMVGQVSEIFDGDPPFAPRGCGAQAWSVAEMLRVLKDRA